MARAERPPRQRRADSAPSARAGKCRLPVLGVRSRSPCRQGVWPFGPRGMAPMRLPLEVRVRDRTRRAETPWAARWRQRRHRGPVAGASRQWTRPKEINAALHAAAPHRPALQPHHPQQPHRPEPEKSARRSPCAYWRPAHRAPLRPSRDPTIF